MLVYRSNGHSIEAHEVTQICTQREKFQTAKYLRSFFLLCYTLVAIGKIGVLFLLKVINILFDIKTVYEIMEMLAIC